MGELFHLIYTYRSLIMSKLIDLTGQVFGDLTVISRAENDKHGHTRWLCRCSCGNEKVIDGGSLKKGLTKSCGCLAKKILREYNQTKEVDETGNKYGRLTVISRSLDPALQKDGRAMWLCQCECGNKVVVAGKLLRNGQTKSCGCLVIDTSRKIGKITGHINGGSLLIDLIGQRFGNLTVISREGSDTMGQALWRCKCECGAETIVRGASLRNGNTTSCGCIRSRGEHAICNLLSSKNIPFEREYVVSIDGHNYRFDFYVNGNYYIEFDGSQHFEAAGSGWNTEENLQDTQRHDAIKNAWCKEHNIPLIRIPYTHLKKLCIDDLKLETSTFIVKD